MTRKSPHFATIGVQETPYPITGELSLEAIYDTIKQLNVARIRPLTDAK